MRLGCAGTGCGYAALCAWILRRPSKRASLRMTEKLLVQWNRFVRV